MARKKVVKKVSRRKQVRKSKPATRSMKMVRSTSKKISVAFKNLAFFLVLFIVSFALYNVFSSEVIQNVFFTLFLIFGFISLGFLIVLLVLALLKSMNK